MLNVAKYSRILFCSGFSPNASAQQQRAHQESGAQPLGRERFQPKLRPNRFPERVPRSFPAAFLERVLTLSCSLPEGVLTLSFSFPETRRHCPSPNLVRALTQATASGPPNERGRSPTKWSDRKSNKNSGRVHVQRGRHLVQMDLQGT